MFLPFLALSLRSLLYNPTNKSAQTLGRGLFATSAIPARTVLDVSPVLVLDPEEVELHVKHTKFWFYTL